MAEDLEQPILAKLTTEIISAYVSHNQIGTAELAELIGGVAGQLGRIGSELEQPAEAVPAVPVRHSIRPGHLVCLVCGKLQKVLKRHLGAAHQLTAAGYREQFGLKPDYPMAAPNYAQQRRELALSIGLGRPRKPTPKPRRKTAARSRAKAQGAVAPAAGE